MKTGRNGLGKTEDRMKIQLRYWGLNAKALWESLVEAQLKRIQHLAAIASAKVSLEWQPEAAPAYRVHAHLEVPGPDFHAEARDHTLQAALQKVIKDLERQIRSRTTRHASRRKTNPALGLGSSHGALGFSGAR
jgi:ribosomal subunit interface protein